MVRRRTLRRWLAPLFGAALVIAALGAVVRRGEEGRRLSLGLDLLETREQVTRDRLAEEVARADSLASLPRIEEAAVELGLRQAEDGEFFHVSDASAAEGAEAAAGR